MGRDFSALNLSSRETLSLGASMPPGIKEAGSHGLGGARAGLWEERTFLRHIVAQKIALVNYLDEVGLYFLPGGQEFHRSWQTGPDLEHDVPIFAVNCQNLPTYNGP